MARKNKLLTRELPKHAGRFAKIMLKSRLLAVFLVLCVLGIVVGAQNRPDPRLVPYGEMFDQMSVVSYRESPSDTTSRFMVELSAGGRVFRQYDVDAHQFLPPAHGRDYARTITGTLYRPLRVRGHVSQGLWLDVPKSTGRSFLPEQFDELYRASLDFVKPMTLLAVAFGTLSGYTIGYHIGYWDASLSSHAVQERVLATPNLGHVVGREAWRRVLLEPLVMADADDASRFAALRGTQQLYANFFRLALNDSDGFIVREAARLASLGRHEESRSMLAFTDAVRRAAKDSVSVSSADFDAVERWASLLMRRGHWAYDAIPPAGEERAKYLGTLAWYGVAPPDPNADRVWVGPRVLVREGESEGFVADEIPATGVGCPIAWRQVLNEEKTGATAMASAWFNDRPEFVALATLGGRAAHGLTSVWHQLAAPRNPVHLASAPVVPSAPVARTVATPPATVLAGFTSHVTTLGPAADSARADSAHTAHADSVHASLSPRDSIR